MLHDGQILVFQIRTAHHNLSRNPRHAALEHRELAFTFGGLPVAGEVGIKSTMLMVHGAREPDAQYILAQHGFGFDCEFHITLLARSNVGEQLQPGRD